MPQALNISPKDLSGVDLIVSEALREKVFPGCQVFAAKDGRCFIINLLVIILMIRSSTG